MSQSDDCLREARDCLESAQAAEDSRIRDCWIELAIEWMKLAAESEMAAVPATWTTETRN